MRKTKPSFFRKDWHKKIKLGKTVKKKRIWRSAVGIHNKIRLGRKGHSSRPKVGWGSPLATRKLIGNVNVVRIMNLSEMATLSQGAHILIGKVGLRKRKQLLAEAQTKQLVVVNSYRKPSLQQEVSHATQ